MPLYRGFPYRWCFLLPSYKSQSRYRRLWFEILKCSPQCCPTPPFPLKTWIDNLSRSIVSKKIELTSILEKLILLVSGNGTSELWLSVNQGCSVRYYLCYLCFSGFSDASSVHLGSQGETSFTYLDEVNAQWSKVKMSPPPPPPRHWSTLVLLRVKLLLHPTSVDMGCHCHSRQMAADRERLMSLLAEWWKWCPFIIFPRLVIDTIIHRGNTASPRLEHWVEKDISCRELMFLDCLPKNCLRSICMCIIKWKPLTMRFSYLVHQTH